MYASWAESFGGQVACTSEETDIGLSKLSMLPGATPVSVHEISLHLRLFATVLMSSPKRGSPGLSRKMKNHPGSSLVLVGLSVPTRSCSFNIFPFSSILKARK